ncbi:hypothetical protein ACRBF7_001647 [Providencia stuartii]
MTRFDKSLFLNNTLNYLRQFGYQAIPSEVKYNLTKGALPLISSLPQ